jgi:hypothetical protein
VANLQTKRNAFVYFNIILTANATTSFIDIGAAGARIDFNICEDVIGGRTWVWPSNFQNTPSIATTASSCTAVSFITPDGLTWNHADSTSITGTATPGAIPYFASGASLGSTLLTYNPNDNSTTGACGSGEPTCASLINFNVATGTASKDFTLDIIAADGLSGVITTPPSDKATNIWFAGDGFESFESGVLSATAMAVAGAAQIGGTTVNGNCFGGGATSPPCALGVYGQAGDVVVGNTATNLDAVSFQSQLSLSRAGSQMHNVANFVAMTPGSCAQSAFNSRPCGATTETTANLWGLEIQDQRGIGTSTIGVHIEPQTNPAAGNFAIKVESGGGPSSFPIIALTASGKMLLSDQTPTVTAGFNTGSISTPNGTAAFSVIIGSGAAGNTGTVGLAPNAANFWSCYAQNVSRGAVIQMSASTNNSATFTNLGTTFAATNWTNGDAIHIYCYAR